MDLMDPRRWKSDNTWEDQNNAGCDPDPEAIIIIILPQKSLAYLNSEFENAVLCLLDHFAF